jgi:hypothetical protein
MFRLHDKTRRRICLAGFVVLCILPTAVVLAWCAWRQMPRHVPAEAARLGRELRLGVSLAGVKHLRPGVVLYEGLELSDPDTDRVVLRCRALEATYRAANSQQQGRPLLTLIASQPEIEAAGLEQLRQLLSGVLERRIGHGRFDLRLAANEVTLRAEENTKTLAGLSASIDSSPEGSQAAVSFRLRGIAASKAMQIRIVRSRQVSPPATGFELDTGGAAVPCDLLALGLPVLGPLGPPSRFRGIIWANQVPDSEGPDCWAVELTGQFLEVDLGRLLSERFTHKLSGMGQVTIQSARFRCGRLEEVCGFVDIGPGVISRSLIDAAVEQLHLARGVKPQQPEDLVQYEQLAVGFVIDAKGLALQGRCTRTDPGAILVDRYNCLLGGPISPRRPDSGVHVPASRQADWLMRRLPLPEAAPAASAQRDGRSDRE